MGKTTVVLDDELIEKALRTTNLKTKKRGYRGRAERTNQEEKQRTVKKRTWNVRYRAYTRRTRKVAF